jgi:hypothetical protein
MMTSSLPICISIHAISNIICQFLFTNYLNYHVYIFAESVSLLIAAGAAMAANCEPCLNKVVPDLIEAGVAEADIRKAMEIGQFVKDKPAAIMKEAADALTGTNMSDPHKSEGCPAEARV